MVPKPLPEKYVELVSKAKHLFEKTIGCDKWSQKSSTSEGIVIASHPGLSKEEASKDVHIRPIFRVSMPIAAKPDDLLAAYLYPENRKKWDPNFCDSSSILESFETVPSSDGSEMHAFVLRTCTPSILSGMISSREFIDLIRVERKGDVIVGYLCGLEEHDMQPEVGFLRALPHLFVVGVCLFCG